MSDRINRFGEPITRMGGPDVGPRQARERDTRDAKDAARYRWLREQIKDGRARVVTQALFWNHNSRKQLDAAIDAAMLGNTEGALQDDRS